MNVIVVPPGAAIDKTRAARNKRWAARTKRWPNSRRVWNAAALKSRATWQLELPHVVAEEFVGVCRSHPELARDIDKFEFDSVRMPKLAAFAKRVRQNLLEGDGVTRLTGLGDLGLESAELRLFHLAFGSAMGTPMTEYGRLYEVKDRGGSYTEETIPVSQTSAGTGFHTDSSRRDCLPDLIGLLCEQPAAEGGDSLVSNALAVHQQLAQRSPDVVRTLHKRFVRDLVTPGVKRTKTQMHRNHFPVFAQHRSGGRKQLVFRYMRYWIERGQENVGAPLAPRETHALDTLDAALASPENAVAFRLERGDMLWVNNCTVAHNRTDYVNDPACPRLLHRMWVKVRGGKGSRRLTKREVAGAGP